MYDFFIAHASADKPLAQSLYDLLSKSHNTFLDKESLETGDNWNKVLAESLGNSKVIIILLSKHSTNAYYLQEEIARAIKQYRSNTNWYRLVPVYVNGIPSDLSEIPYGLCMIHSLDLIKEGGMEAIARKLTSFSANNPNNPEDASLIKTHLCFGHALHSWPEGPGVDGHLVPLSLIEAVAASIDTSYCSIIIDEANSFRKASDPNDTGSITIKQINLPNPNKNKPMEFWLDAFREARLHGPRMLAALLLTVDHRFFPKNVIEQRAKLLELLKTFN